jgi:hypothetical protein
VVLDYSSNNIAILALCQVALGTPHQIKGFDCGAGEFVLKNY